MSNAWASRALKSIKSIDLYEEFIRFPLYIYSRPFKGFGELKYYGRGKTYFAIVTILLSILANVTSWLFSGFVITGYRGGGFYFDFVAEILFFIAPIILFTVANWSITAITDGNGKYRDILMVYCYSIYPQIFFALAKTLVSHVITQDEVIFYYIFEYLGTVMYAVYLFAGLIVIHEYSFFRSVFMILLTILAMGVIVFVLALLFSLVNEVYLFFYTVYSEITLRL